MDPSILRNLDTQHRRLAEAEVALAALLAGETDADIGAVAPAAAVTSGYDRLTARNDALRDDRGWGRDAADLDLDAALDPVRRERFERWCARRRLPWTAADVVVVGLAGVVGSVAVALDTHSDAAVMAALERLRRTPLLRRYERAGKGLAIDCMKEGFGGAGHRGKSAGHDLLRPLAAIKQIRRGRIEGFGWAADGVRVPIGHDVAAVPDLGDALVRWVQHLAADVVTPMSLPLPGWTLLRELCSEDQQKLLDTLYRGDGRGSGLNLRSGAPTPSLPVLTTEVLVRAHVHARVWAATGSPRLDGAHEALCSELLVAAHALVGAASLGATAGALAAGTGPLAVRHLNVPVLARTGALALAVAGEARERGRSAAPTWDVLLGGAAEPWQLHAVAEIGAELPLPGVTGRQA